jgi:hypothetical protein
VVVRRVFLVAVAGSLPAVAVACIASTHPPPLGDCDGPCYLFPTDVAVIKDVVISEKAPADTGAADTGSKSDASADAGADASSDASSDASDAGSTLDAADADDGALVD